VTPPKSMRLSDLRDNPSAVTEAAKTGSVSIVDDEGRHRFWLSVPGEEVACSGEPHTCDQEQIAAAEGRTDRLIIELAERNAQLDAMRNAAGAECVEHVELNGYIDLAEQCRDYLNHQTMDEGDPSGRLQEFVGALRIVIDQCDRQRRRANWYEGAYTAGKQKLMEVSANDEAERIAQWLEYLGGHARTLAAPIRSGAYKENT
jgi:hypothetical protein